MKVAVVALVLSYIAYVSAELPVESCPALAGKSAPTFKQSIIIGNCHNPPCRLKKKTVVSSEFRFTPDRNVKSLTNTVNAIIIGLPFPFIGVDNTDACSQIYESDGATKAGCPLQAGKEYVYKNQFDIKDIYPRIKLVVHWGLTADDGRDVMCFHVPARITN